MLVAALGLTLPVQAQTPVVEAKNADDEAVLQVNADGGLLGLGVFDTGVIPAEGAGTRLMWHPAKAAFRAGRVGVAFFSDGTEWDEANVGDYSVAFGLDATASGSYATAMGLSTTASENTSTAMGYETTAGGDYSLAAGRRAAVRNGDDGTFARADNAASDFTSTGDNQFLVRARGGVGLGTNSPLAQLHIAKAINAAASLTHVAIIENTSTGTNGDVLVLKSGASTPTPSNNFITFLNGGNGFVGAVDGNGSGGVVYRTSGGDFAEMLPRLNVDEAIAPGDVVGVIGGHVTKATAGAEQVLVVTDRPAVLGNAHLDETASSPVAFLGQVPVRGRGAVSAGDWIVPSGQGDGTAVAIAPSAMQLKDHTQVIGRAQIETQQMQIEALQAENTSTQERLARLEAQLVQMASEGPTAPLSVPSATAPRWK